MEAGTWKYKQLITMFTNYILLSYPLGLNKVPEGPSLVTFLLHLSTIPFISVTNFTIMFDGFPLIVNHL